MTRKIFEYDTQLCEVDQLFQTLEIKGLMGWELITLVIQQSMIQKKITEFVNAQPAIETKYQLIFKREKNDPSLN